MTERALRFVGLPLLVLLGLFLLSAPSLLNSFYLRVLSEVLIFALFAMSIDVLTGYTGLPTLGHAGIFGVSAYTAGYLVARRGVGFETAFLAAIVLALVATVIFALVAVRTSGIYFLMITLAQGMIVWGLAFRWNSVTGAENGIRGIHRPDLLNPYWKYYYVILAGTVVLGFLLYRIVNSPFGLTLKGVRESPSRMATLGYDVALHKFLSFMVAGLFAGFAGALYVFHVNFVSPSAVEFARSAEGILMVILGGAGTLFGPAVGSLVVTFTRHQISLYTDRWLIILGGIYVVTILAAPDGLAGGARRLWARLAREGLVGRTPRPSGAEAPARKEVGANPGQAREEDRARDRSGRVKSRSD